MNRKELAEALTPVLGLRHRLSLDRFRIRFNSLMVRVLQFDQLPTICHIVNCAIARQQWIGVIQMG